MPDALTVRVTSFLAPVLMPVISIIVLPDLLPALAPVLIVKVPVELSTPTVAVDNRAISGSLDVAAYP